MPRKKQEKRAISRFRQSLKWRTEEQACLLDFNRRWKSRLPELQAVLGFELTRNQRAYLQAALFIAVVEPLILRHCVNPKKKPYASWRDNIILTLRAILTQKKLSTSLSYSGDQTRIETLFANALRIVFEMMPEHCRGGSASALVARARGLRAKFRLPANTILARQFQSASFMLAAIRWRWDNEGALFDWLKNPDRDNDPRASTPFPDGSSKYLAWKHDLQDSARILA